MPALTDLSDVVNRLTGGSSGAPEDIFFYKDARVGAAAAATPVAGRLISLWQYNGQPAHGAAPGAVRIPTNATDGGLKQTNPAGGAQKWLLGRSGIQGLAATGALALYDRLLDISGFSGTNAGAQNVGGALTRYTNGLGNRIAVEIYTQIGATATTITASYTNQAGTAGRTTQATDIGGTGFREAQRLIILPLQAGDTGVQAVASVTLAGTTGTAGDFGVTVKHLLAWMNLQGVVTFQSGLLGPPFLKEVLTDACLAMAFLSSGAIVPQVYGSVHFVEK